MIGYVDNVDGYDDGRLFVGARRSAAGAHTLSPLERKIVKDPFSLKALATPHTHDAERLVVRLLLGWTRIVC